MSRSQDKRLTVQRRDHKVYLFEKEFGAVGDAIDYGLSIYGKPLSEDNQEILRSRNYDAPHATYFTERVSLGGSRWVVKVSTWIPKES